MPRRKQGKSALHRTVEVLWDLWCIGTVVGIWPRFIEPQLLTTTKVKVHIPELPSELEGLRIVQFSDLHLGPHVSNRFLRRVRRQIAQLDPDVLCFTGDFICYSQLNDSERLLNFLQSLSAPYGLYASLGNHDYGAYASVKPDGTLGVVENDPPSILKGLGRLFRNKNTVPAAPSYDVAPTHSELCELIERSPFTLLENQCHQIKVGQSQINICGLGDLWAGRFDPENAFAEYAPESPGIVLSHNPDTLPRLRKYPGDLILCGHTHGGQVNISFIRNRIIEMACPEYLKGRYQIDDKTAYINRGIGAVVPFRCFALPELTSLTLTGVQDD